MRFSPLAFVTAILLLIAPPAVRAQDRPAQPTRVPAETTPAQEETLRAGVELHDQEKFDEAIARYQAVLAENPSNVTALFELAYSYLAKKDYARVLETARQGAEYKSELLPMFYDVMASALDSQGEPQQAIEMYRRGIALAPDASQLYYNMAVTYRESLNQQDEARGALEQAATLEPMHPGVQLLLGQVFQSSGYTAPAFLALSKYLVLDPRGAQSLNGYGLWRALLKGNGTPSSDMPSGDRAMRPPTPAPASSKADEGDFSAFESQLGPTRAAFMLRMEDGTPEIQALVVQVDTLIGTLPARASGPAAQSFVNVHYVPFFRALQQRRYVEPFVYWVSQRAPVPGVTEWLQANQARVREFVEWASNYDWAVQ
jgi:Tfp pilus assembly protein PilF